VVVRESVQVVTAGRRHQVAAVPPRGRDDKGATVVEMSIVNNANAGRVDLHVDGELAGYLSYELTDNVLSFTAIHTDLTRAGQGLGVVLVRKSLDAADGDGLFVLPVCPFVRDFIGRHPRYLDLVPPDQRERFGLPATPPAWPDWPPGEDGGNVIADQGEHQTAPDTAVITPGTEQAAQQPSRQPSVDPDGAPEPVDEERDSLEQSAAPDSSSARR
jgi:uncharacterized protein